jgi:hypothetical protein
MPTDIYNIIDSLDDRIVRWHVYEIYTVVREEVSSVLPEYILEIGRGVQSFGKGFQILGLLFS